MARVGSGGVLDALAVVSAPLRTSRHAGWVCPSCRDHRPAKQQRRFAYSDVAPLANTSSSGADDPLLAFKSRDSRRKLRSDKQAGDAPPPENHPLKTFLARQDRQISPPPRQEPAISSSAGDSLRTAIVEALREEDANKLVAAVGEAAETSPAALRGLPGNTWSEIIKALDPERHLIAPLHENHRALTGRTNAGARALFQHSRSSWVELLSTFVEMCQRVGVSLSLEQYRLLLRFAANMGAKHLAGMLWNVMRNADIHPDLDCYNYRMEAILFNEGSRLMQAKGAQKIRSEEPEMQVHSRITVFRPGDSPAIKKLVQALEARGMKADTRTYCSLITALARDGDMTGVSRILSSVWRLDVHAIGAGKAISHVSAIDATNPLYPNARLVVTIADAFGSHGNLAIAVRLIDMISQHYNVPVMSNVWFRLLQWTGLYARLANNEARRSGHSNSSLSQSARRAHARRTYLNDVDMLFETMTSAPYNVRPTLDMLHFMQKNSLGQGLLGNPKFTAFADMGRERYASAVADFREGQYQLRKHTAGQAALNQGLTPPGTTARVDRRARIRKMRRMLGLHYLKWWTHLIVEHSVPASTQLAPEEAEGIREWQLRGLPDFAARYRGLMPKAFRYRTPGGLVHIFFRTGEDVEQSRMRKKAAGSRRRFQMLKEKSVRWPWDARARPWNGRSKLIERPRWSWLGQQANRAKMAKRRAKAAWA